MIKKQLHKITYGLIVLLLLNTGLSNAAYTMASGSESAGGSEKILVCTSQGFKWVLLSEFIDNAGSSSESHGGSMLQHCPFCQFVYHSVDGSLNNTALSLSLNPCYTHAYTTPVASVFSSHHLLLFTLSPRAPPIT